MMSRSKRLFDLAGACAGLVVFAPAMAVIAMAILLDDGAPLLFTQPRLGYRRRPFSILKFRSMRDGRVTRVGRILRATGLDEVPQFINILRGDMSGVGPRPLTPADVDRLGWTGAEVEFRWQVKPGLTGLAQLMGAGTSTASLELDRAYCLRWDPAHDCQLIAISFAVNVLGKSRVRRWMLKRYLNASIDALWGALCNLGGYEGVGIVSGLSHDDVERGGLPAASNRAAKPSAPAGAMLHRRRNRSRA
jgi:lipopolysaccharide/colanic/teichoic acid biosynthesis glycosyltransferase